MPDDVVLGLHQFYVERYRARPQLQNSIQHKLPWLLIFRRIVLDKSVIDLLKCGFCFHRAKGWNFSRSKSAEKRQSIDDFEDHLNVRKNIQKLSQCLHLTQCTPGCHVSPTEEIKKSSARLNIEWNNLVDSKPHPRFPTTPKHRWRSFTYHCLVPIRSSRLDSGLNRKKRAWSNWSGEDIPARFAPGASYNNSILEATS